MKKIKTKLRYTLYIVLVSFLMVGCTETITKEEQNNRIARRFKTIEVDGCEYLYREGNRTGFLAHKGNCKNH
tara:strand:+ start:400 stop:615 length:216 start_codon:yes stop_codon:yes gene_type:complete